MFSRLHFLEFLHVNFILYWKDLLFNISHSVYFSCLKIQHNGIACKVICTSFPIAHFEENARANNRSMMIASTHQGRRNFWHAEDLALAPRSRSNSSRPKTWCEVRCAFPKPRRNCQTDRSGSWQVSSLAGLQSAQKNSPRPRTKCSHSRDSRRTSLFKSHSIN